MGWENRGNKYYYYRKKRIGKKVISEYIGFGPDAEKIAREDDLAKRKREKARLAWQHRQAEIRAMDDALDSIETITRSLVNANLLLAGYHTHKGQWRKKRNVQRRKNPK
jgi:hypothetical protein